MELATFKAQNSITSLSFYKSASGRNVASVGSIRLVTTNDFEATKPAHVYENNAQTTVITPEEGTKLYWLTNKEPKEAAFTL